MGSEKRFHSRSLEAGFSESITCIGEEIVRTEKINESHFPNGSFPRHGVDFRQA